MSTHTPAPWHLDTYEDGSMAICPQAGFTITPVKPRPGFDQDIPNFKLMATAPELLEALREIQANPNDPRCHRKAMDAMKKATGYA